MLVLYLAFLVLQYLDFLRSDLAFFAHDDLATLVRRLKQNAPLKAKTEQCITAKISRKALKQESKKCNVSAVDNCINIRLRIKTVE